MLWLLAVFGLGGITGAVLVRLAMQPRGHWQAEFQPGPAAVDAQRKLDQVIDRIQWDSIPFQEAIDSLRKTTSASIHVNWGCVEAAGISRLTPVTMDLSRVKLSQALLLTLDSVGAGQVKLGFTGRDGVIIVSTADDVARNTIMRLYDVRDIVASYLTLPQEYEQYIFEASSRPSLDMDSEHDRGKVLESLVEDSISPDSWRDNGGSVGACSYLAGRLIVCAPPETQNSVQKLLAELREDLPARPPPPAPRVVQPVKGSLPLPELTASLAEALSRQVDEFVLDSVPFGAALEQIRQRWAVQIEVEKDALKEAGFDEPAPLSLHCRKLTLSQTLSSLLAQPIGGVHLAFIPVDDHILISTREKIEAMPFVRVYNVRDLIPGIGYQPPREGVDRRSRQDMIDDLLSLIERSVDPDTWKDNGGNIGAMRQMYGELIVTQTRATHARIDRFLQTLRQHGITLDAIRGRRAHGPQTLPAAGN